MSRQRADLVLVARGFFPTRAKAQEAIALGLVRIGDKVLDKASTLIDDASSIAAEKPYPWVSRAGVKLAAALDAFGFDPAGCLCLDVGASTGGFSEVLLSRGAARIYAVDVGHGQLDQRLAADTRVIAMEGTDARHLAAGNFIKPPGFITCDVSFISLRLVLPHLLPLAAPGAKLVALIKPQFEVGPGGLVKGIVKDATLRQKACDDIEALLRRAGWAIKGLIASPIEGGDGNQEYLIGATNPGATDQSP